MSNQNSNNYNRRKFIYDASLSSIAVIFTSFLTGGCEDILDKIKNRPIRRMIRNTAASNHATDVYRAAVAAMKALGSGDKRNWTKQADIHNNFCPHGNWFFFPWHRAYLFEFEKICQKLTNDNTFGLPYWNWCVDGHLPAPFWTPPNPNALFDSNRSVTSSSVASASSVGLSLVDGFCNEPSFTLFAGGASTGLRTGGGSYGNIEATPHNYIHGSFVRGDMATFMSPLDAIFWSHHCMVDLCWYEWNVTRNHANTNDTNWTNFNMPDMFCDADGNNVTDMTVLATILMPILSYQYETDIAGKATVHKKSMKDKAAFEKMKKVIQEGASTQLKRSQQASLKRGVEFNVQRQPVSETIPMNIESIRGALVNNSNDRMLLTIKNMTHPSNSDVFIRVFINKPDANPQTPIEDPHYAGSFFFFDHANGGNHNHGMSGPLPDYIVDITETLKRLQSREELTKFKDGIMINLVAVPVPGVQTQTQTLTIQDLELSVSPVEVKLMDIQ